MKAKGKDLIFISRILRDGSATEPVIVKDTGHLDNRIFKCNCLSMTKGTFIASEFNSYVVKLKRNESIN